MTAIESGRVEVDRLFGFERDLAAKWRAALADLTTMQAASGDQLLATTEAGNADEVLKRVSGAMAKLRSELETFLAAIVSVRTQRREAILRMWKIEAAGLRDGAAGLRTEAADRQKKTDRLLEKLQEFEEVSYQVGPPIPKIGTCLDPPQIPLTQKLLDEAQRLGGQAARLEARPVIDSGEAFGTTVDELLTVVTANPLRIAPTIPEILLWVEPAFAAAVAQRARRTMNNLPDETPITLELRWKGGAIEATSRAYLPPL